MKRVTFVLKLLLFTASVTYIAYKISKDRGSLSPDLFVESLGFRDSWLLLGTFLLLVPVNWGLESLKWRQLLGYAGIRADMRTAITQTLCSLSLGIFTPNRIGETAAKIYMAAPGTRMKAAGASLAGSAVQFMASFGGLMLAWSAMAGLWSGQDGKIDLFYSEFTPVLIYLLLCVVLVVVLVWYWAKFVSPQGKAARFALLMDSLKLRTSSWIALYGIAVTRYVVILLQYWIVLYWFGIVDPDWKGWVLIPLVLFTSSAIPMFFPGDVGVRGAAAVHFLEPVCIDTEAILYASVFIWFCNVALPALAGSVFIFRLKDGSSGK